MMMPKDIARLAACTLIFVATFPPRAPAVIVAAFSPSSSHLSSSIQPTSSALYLYNRDRGQLSPRLHNASPLYISSRAGKQSNPRSHTQYYPRAASSITAALKYCRDIHILFGTDNWEDEARFQEDLDFDPTLVLEGELGPIDLEEIDSAKLSKFQSDVPNVRAKRDLSNDYFGPLLPIAEKVDDLTGGWGLSYADLHPETPQTPLGVAFLATNACYAVGGLALGVQGEWTLGLLTEFAGIVSFWYHYSQLNFGQDKAEVRLALLIDYMTAGTALLCGGAYMVQMGIDAVPFDALIWGGVSVVCLTLCWVREFGYWYLFWHSLWHIFSAYTGYVVGQANVLNHNGMNMLS